MKPADELLRSFRHPLGRQQGLPGALEEKGKLSREFLVEVFFVGQRERGSNGEFPVWVGVLVADQLDAGRDVDDRVVIVIKQTVAVELDQGRESRLRHRVLGVQRRGKVDAVMLVGPIAAVMDGIGRPH